MLLCPAFIMLFFLYSWARRTLVPLRLVGPLFLVLFCSRACEEGVGTICFGHFVVPHAIRRESSRFLEAPLRLRCAPITLRNPGYTGSG